MWSTKRDYQPTTDLLVGLRSTHLRLRANQHFADIAELLSRLEYEHPKKSGGIDGNHTSDHHRSTSDRGSANVALQLWLGLLPERWARLASRRGDRAGGCGNRIASQPRAVTRVDRTRVRSHSRTDPASVAPSRQTGFAALRAIDARNTYCKSAVLRARCICMPDARTWFHWLPYGSPYQLKMVWVPHSV